MKVKTEITSNKPRKCASVFQVRELENTFESDPRPSHDKRIQLAKRLDMLPRTVQIWFQNRRAKARSQNHLMVKTVNCSTSAGALGGATADATGAGLPMFPFLTKPKNHLDIPYCFSPQGSESLMCGGGNPSCLDGYGEEPYSLALMDTLTEFRLPTPPGVSTPPSQSYSQFELNPYGVDSWGVPYAPYGQHHLVDFPLSVLSDQQYTSTGELYSQVSHPWGTTNSSYPPPSYSSFPSSASGQLHSMSHSMSYPPLMPISRDDSTELLYPQTSSDNSF